MGERHEWHESQVTITISAMNAACVSALSCRPVSTKHRIRQGAGICARESLPDLFLHTHPNKRLANPLDTWGGDLKPLLHRPIALFLIPHTVCKRFLSALHVPFVKSVRFVNMIGVAAVVHATLNIPEAAAAIFQSLGPLSFSFVS